MFGVLKEPQNSLIKKVANFKWEKFSTNFILLFSTISFIQSKKKRYDRMLKKLIIYYGVLLSFSALSLIAIHVLDVKLKEQQQMKMIKSIAMQQALEDIQYFNFIKKIIPTRCEHFVRPFYDYTKNDKTVGIELLAIAQHESQWRVFRSPKNRNGTRDYGPLMINSVHFNNTWFKKLKGEYEDINIVYMVGGIQIYKDLRTRHSAWDSFRMYNGGEHGGLKKAATIRYAESVSKYYTSFMESWRMFKKQTQKIQPNFVIIPSIPNLVSTRVIHKKLNTHSTIIPFIKKIRIRILSRRLYYLA